MPVSAGLDLIKKKKTFYSVNVKFRASTKPRKKWQTQADKQAGNKLQRKHMWEGILTLTC